MLPGGPQRAELLPAGGQGYARGWVLVWEVYFGHESQAGAVEAGDAAAEAGGADAEGEFEEWLEVVIC